MTKPPPDGARLPQSQWKPFVVRVCARCGHAEGDHVSAGAVIAPVRGVCKRCDCPQYVEEEQ